jgi:hypothetical protein
MKKLKFFFAKYPITVDSSHELVVIFNLSLPVEGTNRQCYTIIVSSKPIGSNSPTVNVFSDVVMSTR